MRTIDGSGGGGQVVRTAVSLSALTGRAVRVEDVRGNRPTPGMRPQHVAAVEAAAALCDAAVEGAAEGAETLVFEPGDLAAADVEVDVGTAGSVALVFDTVSPLAFGLEAPASVTVTGGTDVAWAPPLSYLERVKLPAQAAAGLDASLSVDARGFYPVGGGRATLAMRPSTPERLAMTDRGDLERVEVHSLASEDLADAEVAERQADAVVAGLDAGAILEAPAAVAVDAEASYVDAACTGSSLVVAATYERSRAGFSALGEAGKPSETVAAEALADFERFHAGAAAVDRHLADQLVVHLALGGGAVRGPELTAHLETNRAVVEAFGYDVSIRAADDTVLVEA